MKRCGRCLLLIVLAVLPVPTQAQTASGFGRFHALVIGCQNYKHLKTLQTPLADAEAVAQVLQDQYGFTVKLLRDENREAIIAALFDLRSTMGEEDSLLIYYAGHGEEDSLSDTGYWQPTDAAGNPANWISVDDINSQLRAIRAKHVLIIADSCYAGKLLTRESDVKFPSAASRAELLRRMQAKRSLTALTSGGKEPVKDGGGGRHSVFAKALLDVLRDNKEIFDGSSLFEQIRRLVILNAEQTPQYGDIRIIGGGHEGGDFIFVPKEIQETGVQQIESGAKTDLGFLERGNASSPKNSKQDDSVTGMEFVYVPGGCFQMGSPESEKGHDNDEKLHEVCVDSFYMGKTEVTQGQWKKVMGSNPAKFQKRDDYPVEQVSWIDAQDFIKKLNNKSGKQYRLPTEAEWEYAARAGTSTARHWGDDISCDKAMYENDPGSSEDSCVEYVTKRGLTPDSTAPVGSYPANQFGLHDMLGNVWEWCADWYGEYEPNKKENPVGASSGSDRVIRGGCWSVTPEGVRAADRIRFAPDDRGNFLGFRLLLSGQQGQAQASR